ncbi:MAG: DUF5686 family protein [Bacteroidota bacterium]
MRIFLSIFFSFFIIPFAASAQQAVVSGIISDSASGDPLRFVTVRAEGTKNGNISTTGGKFLLKLKPGEYTLSFSMIGYETIQQKIFLKDSLKLHIRMREAAFTTADVVVTAEDPAVAIMRKVLKRKEAQRDSILNYSYTLYTKFVVSADSTTAGRSSRAGDTAIMSILESFSKGYFKKPDQYFNEILQRRQSANIPAGANFVSFGTNINAYDDYVQLLNQEIATPFHPDAIDYYDFVLERETYDGERTVTRIKVTPASSQRKLFEGYINVDADRAIPIEAELTPNRAVQLPFDAKLTYQQRFDEFDKFIMPAGLRISTSAEAGILWVFAPRLDIDIENVAYDYEFNKVLDDELFQRRRVESVKSAEVFDSTFWRENNVLPLRAEEIEAYDVIQQERDNPDSVLNATIIDRFFGDVTRVIARLNRTPFTGFEDIIRYNRVHGAYLGLGLTDSLTDFTVASLKGGYGFADKRVYGEALLKQYLDENGKYSFDAGYYRRLARRDNPYTVQAGGITQLAFLFKNDYGDYYYADGAEIGFEAGFGQLRFIRREMFARPTGFRLFFKNEFHEPAGVNENFSIFNRSRSFRDNPAAIAGTLRSFGGEFNYRFNSWRRVSDFGFQLKTEFANTSLLKSSFDFQQYQFAMILRTPTFLLWKLSTRVLAGFTKGKTPPQRFFSLESSASATAGEGVLRGMSVKEFYGDRYFHISAEHNWGEIIPGLLRIPNIASFGVEFITFGNFAWTEFSKETLNYTQTHLPTTSATPDKFYYEAGLGFNRLLLFFRFDVTARLSQVEKPRFMFTVSGATP